MDDLTKINSYGVREMPARNMFLYRYHSSVERYNDLTKMDALDKDYIINQTGIYVFNICKCVAIVSSERPDVVLSFVMYIDSFDGPIIYYAFTKKELRNKGYFRRIMTSLGVRNDRKIMVCYTGPVPTYLRYKTVKKRAIL